MSPFAVNRHLRKIHIVFCLAMRANDASVAPVMAVRADAEGLARAEKGAERRVNFTHPRASAVAKFLVRACRTRTRSEWITPS
jgi:hypothetical protein